MMEKLKELDVKIQNKRPRGNSSNPYFGQIHIVEELYNEEELDKGVMPEEEMAEEEFGTPQNVDAYYAQVNMTASEKFEHPWDLDLGAFHHVTGEREVFTSLTSSRGTRITTIGGQGHNVASIGNIAIKLSSREIQKIEHVLYSRGIVKNLLSVGFLTSRGMSLEFTTNTCTIKNSLGEIITNATKQPDSGVYKLLGETLLQCSETLLT